MLDEERALRTLPTLLGDDAEERKTAVDILHKVLAARGALPDEGKRRLARVEALLGVSVRKSAKAEAINA
jgi:hypothetical protein